MFSIVIPVKDECENIAPLLKELAALHDTLAFGEAVFVDDGSADETLKTLKSLWDKYPFLRVVSHDHSAGQSAALWTGIRAAANDIVVTMDGDGQNDPADIALLYECYQQHADADHPVMIMGQRQKRQDNFVRRMSSRIANCVRAGLLRDGTRDTGCSLKMFRRQDYVRLPYFNHMHRFLPALMIRQGVSVKHIDVSHRPRVRGISKYGMWDRLWVGIFDILGVMWLQRRACPVVTVLEE